MKIYIEQLKFCIEKINLFKFFPLFIPNIYPKFREFRVDETED